MFLPKALDLTLVLELTRELTLELVLKLALKLTLELDQELELTLSLELNPRASNRVPLWSAVGGCELSSGSWLTLAAGGWELAPAGVCMLAVLNPRAMVHWRLDC